MPILRLDQLVKFYHVDSLPAVAKLSLSIDEGEVLALLGPSGSGKTTVLRMIAGFEDVDGGCIILNDRPLANARLSIPPEERGIGMVFQDLALFPHLTVGENVAFGLHQQSEHERGQRVVGVLELVGLSGFQRRYPHELSGGQQQRVALARALAPPNSIILLDEPFSNLDAGLRVQMRQEVGQILRRAGTTAILVTHDQQDAFEIADRVAVINHGQIEQVGMPESIYHTPATRFVASFVGQANFLPGMIKDGEIDTEVGTFTSPERLPDGAVVEVMIRPDDVHYEGSAAGVCKLSGRRFRGSENYYEIVLPSGARVHSSQPSSVFNLPGTKVQVMVELEHVVIFHHR